MKASKKYSWQVLSALQESHLMENVYVWLNRIVFKVELKKQIVLIDGNKLGLWYVSITWERGLYNNPNMCTYKWK